MTTVTHDAQTLKALKKKSHHLSWLLRHGANEAGLPMDSAGWAPVDRVLALAALTRDELLVVVAENNKSRYELSPDGARVRASQGHSTAGTPVTQAGLEASWLVVVDEADVFHGTSVASARAILAPTSDGIHSAARTHVHLAAAVDSSVGKRAEVDVLLVVRPALLRQAGLALFRAPNGVLLARRVPSTSIVAVRAATRAGDRALAELQALVR